MRITIESVPASDGCRGCVFRRPAVICYIGSAGVFKCHAILREDGVGVIFKEVKDETHINT